MAQTSTHSILTHCTSALGLPDHVIERLNVRGVENLPSCFPVTDLAAASIGAAGLALTELLGGLGQTVRVEVDRRLASLWFGFTIAPKGWTLPNAWDAIAGDYAARDGWIKLHTNAPHHKQAALSALGCGADRDAVAAAVAERSAEELESAIVEEGGCAAALRSRSEWQEHSQGRSVIAEPLVHWEQASHGIPSAWKPTIDRPLAGLRVLDLTRILAGPVATRFLAGFGADVLRIDPLEWDEPAIAPDVTLGKRCARLDLHRQPDRAKFEQLLSQADVLVHGYRRDALEAMGLGAAARQIIRPGLIDVSLNAYGHSGPWANRRGFDSLVQLSSGIAGGGMAWRGAERPVSLPVQALDHATGYLMAAAVIRGLNARLSGSAVRAARLSLARTAELLFVVPGRQTPTDFPSAASRDYVRNPEFTPWGPARRLKPPLRLSTCALQWDRPAQMLGSARAHWVEGRVGESV